MEKRTDPTEPKEQPPVIRYAAVIGIIVVIGIIATVIIGQRTENPRPTGVLTSPAPGASVGPTPRY